MQKLLRSANTRLYIYLGGLLLLAAVWRAGESVNARFEVMPVKEAPRIDRGTIPLDAKSFYPVWVKQAAAMPQVTQDSEVDELFRKREEAKPEMLKPVEPDYVEIFKASATVDGVSDNGAFVGGQFYKVGAKLHEFAIASANGQTVVPVLHSIKNGKITFTIAGRTLSFVYGGGKR